MRFVLNMVEEVGLHVLPYQVDPSIICCTTYHIKVIRNSVFGRAMDNYAHMTKQYSPLLCWAATAIPAASEISEGTRSH